MSEQHIPRADLPQDLSRVTFWQVEGSLLNLTAVHPVAFFAWNSQSFLQRWMRRGGLLGLALTRPLLYLSNRAAATRVMHLVLRGVSRDRLDLLGEEYAQYLLRPKLKPAGLAALEQARKNGEEIVLFSQGLDHVIRPLAQHLGVSWILANRLDFRDGMATGRLLAPMVLPRGPLARFTGTNPDGRVPLTKVRKRLRPRPAAKSLGVAIQVAKRPAVERHVHVVRFENESEDPLSVKKALRGKTVLVAGATGFIGKVWLANLLSDVPEVGRLVLLIRRRKLASAAARFQKILEESPLFAPLRTQLGVRFESFIAERIEVLDGDLSRPGFGLDSATQARLARTVDLVVNSSGLTDFNPDLRDALQANVASVANLLDFLRRADHAALLHLSTCYAAGERDGRIAEDLAPNYSPRKIPGFRAEDEWLSLQEMIRATEAQAESAESTSEFRRSAMIKPSAARLGGAALENQVRKNRARWLRQTFTEAGTRRANELGWPNTYTLTKGFAESLIVQRGAGLPIAIVRPSIVESTLEKPFRGWNEGINTSASLSYLLGTFFRQLPTNERKCLDIIPVDQVTRGMMLISSALLSRRHQPLYHLATSVTNPCNMRRSIELTSLAHRKFYRTQDGFETWLRSRFDAIPVSKERYEKLSAPAQKAVIQAINRGASSVGLPNTPLARRERDLERVIKLIDLFKPFILRNDHTFEALHIEQLSAALVPEERQLFAYEARKIDWWDYWINVHIPALRKWCYPLIEGRPAEMRNGEEPPPSSSSAGQGDAARTHAASPAAS